MTSIRKGEVNGRIQSEIKRMETQPSVPVPESTPRHESKADRKEEVDFYRVSLV